MLKKGDNIKVKKGIKIPDLEEFDMSDWQGRIVGFVESDEVKGEYFIDVEWDSLTIKDLSMDYIKKNIANGFGFDSIILDKNEVEKTVARDKPHDRTTLITAIEQRLKYANIPSAIEGNDLKFDNDDLEFDDEDDSDEYDEDDVFDTIFMAILGKNIKVTNNNIKKYYNFINANITLPCVLTGIESMGYDFGWEEKYDFGYGSKKEREAIRKNSPSHNDEFEFLKFIPRDIEAYETIPVMVRRTDDNKIFTLRLDELKAINEKSPNDKLLNDFSTWIVNY